MRSGTTNGGGNNNTAAHGRRDEEARRNAHQAFWRQRIEDAQKQQQERIEAAAGSEIYTNELAAMNALTRNAQQQQRRGSEQTIKESAEASSSTSASASGSASRGRAGGLRFRTGSAKPKSAKEVERVSFGNLQIEDPPVLHSTNRAGPSATFADVQPIAQAAQPQQRYPRTRTDSTDSSATFSQATGPYAGADSGPLMSSAASIVTNATDEMGKPPSYYSRTGSSDGSVGRPSASPASVYMALPLMPEGIENRGAGPSMARNLAARASANGSDTPTQAPASVQVPMVGAYDPETQGPITAGPKDSPPPEGAVRGFGFDTHLDKPAPLGPDMRAPIPDSYRLNARGELLPAYHKNNSASGSDNGLTPPARYAWLPQNARPITAASFRAGAYQQGRIALQAQQDAEIYTIEHHHGLPGTEAAARIAVPSPYTSRDDLLHGDEEYDDGEYEGEYAEDEYEGEAYDGEEDDVLGDRYIRPKPPLRTMSYGLDLDMRTRIERKIPISSGFIPHGHTKMEEQSIKTFTPTFNVEMAAKSFDENDRPVYAGRAPLLRGIVRLPNVPNKYLAIRVSTIRGMF